MGRWSYRYKVIAVVIVFVLVGFLLLNMFEQQGLIFLTIMAFGFLFFTLAYDAVSKQQLVQARRWLIIGVLTVFLAFIWLLIIVR